VLCQSVAFRQSRAFSKVGHEPNVTDTFFLQQN
jgi:hypothetical protein